MNRLRAPTWTTILCGATLITTANATDVQRTLLETGLPGDTAWGLATNPLPVMLAATDKVFCVDDQVLSYYQHVSGRSPFPLALGPDRRLEASLGVGDDVATAQREDRLQEILLTLHLGRPLERSELQTELNGRTLEASGHRVEGDQTWVDYPVDAASCRLGANDLTVAYSPTAPEQSPLQLKRVRLFVRYKQRLPSENRVASCYSSLV